MFLLNFKARARTPEDADQVCRLFRHTLQLMQEPGYARGICGVCVDDNRLVWIEEEWGSMAALKAWLESTSHQQLIQQVMPLIEGASETSIFEERM